MSKRAHRTIPSAPQARTSAKLDRALLVAFLVVIGGTSCVVAAAPGSKAKGPPAAASEPSSDRPKQTPPTVAAAALEAPPTSAKPLSDEVDTGTVRAWYDANQLRFGLDPNASAEQLAYSVNVLDFVLDNEEAAWERLGPVVERALADGANAMPVAALRPNKEQAARYHAAAEPLIQKPKDERDPDLENRLYLKAVLFDPSDPDLYNHVSIAYTLKKDYVRAERFAKLALAIDPTFLSAYQELAYIYKSAGRYQECVELADRAIKKDGDLHTKSLILARQGQAYWLLKDEEKAMASFRTAKRLGAPGWVESYLNGEQTLGQEYNEPKP